MTLLQSEYMAQAKPGPCYHSLLTLVLPLGFAFAGASFAPFGPTAMFVAGDAANDIAWT